MPYRDHRKRRARDRERHRRRAEHRRAQGLCPRCGRNAPDPGRSQCAVCLEKRRAADRLRAGKRRAAGIKRVRNTEARPAEYRRGRPPAAPRACRSTRCAGGLRPVRPASARAGPATLRGLRRTPAPEGPRAIRAGSVRGSPLWRQGRQRQETAGSEKEPQAPSRAPPGGALHAMRPSPACRRRIELRAVPGFAAPIRESDVCRAQGRRAVHPVLGADIRGRAAVRALHGDRTQIPPGEVRRQSRPVP